VKQTKIPHLIEPAKNPRDCGHYINGIATFLYLTN